MCCSLLLSVGWTDRRWAFQVVRREWFSSSCLLTVLEKLGVLVPTTTLLSFAYNSGLNKVEVTSSMMDSKNKDWVCLCTYCLSHCQTLFPCCCSEFNQSTPEEIKCGESDQHADPCFVLYSPGDGPCEFCRCLIMEQNTWRSRLVPWLQQWVCRQCAWGLWGWRASQALIFAKLMCKVRNKVT